MIKIKNIFEFKESVKEFVKHTEDDSHAITVRDHGLGTFHCWYKHGERHRDNDQPAYIGSDGDQEWWQHGKFIK